MANQTPLSQEDWYSKTYPDESPWGFGGPTTTSEHTLHYDASKGAYNKYAEGFNTPATIGTSGLTQEEVGGLSQWDFMQRYATGELGKELPEKQRYLTENMKYMFEPYFQQATGKTYQRGFTKEGTQLGKAYEPLYKASTSALGEALTGAWSAEDAAKRGWEALRIQEEYGQGMLAETEAAGRYKRTDQGIDFMGDFGLPVALMLAQQFIAPGTPPIVT